MSNQRFIHGKVVLITGASSGIGKCLAESLANRGYKVYGTSRLQNIEVNHGPLLELGSNSDGFVKMIQLDVCKDYSVKQAVDYILEKEGRIDILVNNAGFGIAGAIEDTTSEEAYKQFDVNFFGALRMSRRIIPVMRKQKRGLIINISSVAGIFPIPFQSMYSASKYALEAVSEALRIEVAPFGIKAVLIEPGDVNTGFTKSRYFVDASRTDSVYNHRFKKSINCSIACEEKSADLRKVIKAIIRIIELKNPPVRIIIGLKYKFFVFFKRILPSRTVELILAKIFG